MRLVYLLLGWCAGMFLSANFAVLTLWLWGLACALAGAAAYLLRKKPPYRWAALVLLACTLGGLRHALVPTTSAIATYNNTGGLTIEGVVIREPDLRDDRVQLHVQVDTLNRGAVIGPTEGLVLVRAARLTDVQYGDRIAATGALITPAEFDLFSYADYLAQQGVFSIMQYAAVEVLAEGGANSFSRHLIDLRRRVQVIIGQHLPEPQAGLLTGILVGNERGISPQLNEDFQAVGASHIIAISGFNMVIIAGVVMGLLEGLRVQRWPRTLIGIAVIAVYTLFAGANPAIVRAAIMTSTLYVGHLLGRSTYVPASLAFVALLMSVFDPSVLWSISFQLSFFATLGLALFTAPFQRAFDALVAGLLPQKTAGALSGFLSEPLIVTLASLVFTLPLSVIYFGRLSPMILPVNLLIVPVQAYLLIIGGAATILAFVLPPVAQVLYWVDMVLLSWTIRVVRGFAALPNADAAFYVDGRLIWLYFGVLISGAMLQATRPAWWLGLVKLLRRRALMHALLFCGLAMVILTGALFRSRPDGYLHVWFLDVGHSNAVLMQSPGGAHLLVDGGRFPSRLLTSIGDRLPFTDREIEVLFITHPDESDIAALTALLSRYRIGVAITNGQPNLSDTFTQLTMQLSPYDVVAATAGYTLELSDGLRVEVLHPQRPPLLADNLSDHVLVLRVSYGEISFLLTSDLSERGQAALLAGGQWPLATVLQVPQHGTRRALNPAFLAAVQPQAFAIQADRANRLGDPNPDTLALLPEGRPLFRTDEGGVIHFWTDGETLWATQGG